MYPYPTTIQELLLIREDRLPFCGRSLQVANRPIPAVLILRLKVHLLHRIQVYLNRCFSARTILTVVHGYILLSHKLVHTACVYTTPMDKLYGVMRLVPPMKIFRFHLTIFAKGSISLKCLQEARVKY